MARRRPPPRRCPACPCPARVTAGARRTAASRRSCRTSTARAAGLAIGSLAAAHRRWRDARALAARPAAVDVPAVRGAQHRASRGRRAHLGPRGRGRSSAPVHVVIIAGGAGKPSMVAPARADRGRAPAARRRSSISFLATAGEAPPHQRGDRGRRSASGRSSTAAAISASTEGAFHVSNLHVQAAKDASFALAHDHARRRLARNDAVAVLDGEGAHVDLDGCYLADGTSWSTTTPRIDHAHAALHQPRALQGHPGRQGQGGLQRPDHRPPRRAEDRREADQPGAAAVGRGDHRTRTRSSRSLPTT